MIELVLPLDDPAVDLATVGGKGASLARLAVAGLPVPGGFHVTTRAYREFVTGELAGEIRAALARDDAAAEIEAAFARRPMPADLVDAVRAVLPDRPVAVRSSATAEDLPSASFAGQHDTFLDVRGVEAVLDAIRRCWASLWTARAIAYRRAAGIAGEDVAIAVVVQELVPADAAGVLFTANPVTGARDELVINAAWGLGEALVGGRVTPDTYVVARGGGERRREVNDKTVRTVPDGAGTREEPVPDDLRRAPVLDPARAEALARLGERIEDLYGTPVDVEWILHNGQWAIVQARPVTGLAEVWNDSLAGDYLWTAGNMGEAIPSVMTPATWSLVNVLTPPPIGPHRVSGNIGGRFYLNLSSAMAAASALGLGRIARRGMELTLGRLPEGVEIPPLPMSRLAVLRAAITAAVPMLRASNALRRRLPELAARNPRHCRDLRARLVAAATASELHRLWRTDIRPLLYEVCPVFEAGARLQSTGRLERRLAGLVGAGDAHTLLTGLHGAGGELASLGPLLGLARVRDGELDRETYVDTWGHRGPDEFEVSTPRPAEDPAWLDHQLATLTGPAPLLARQAAARAAAWERLTARHPRKTNRIGRRLAKAAEKGRARERARSEFVRTFWVFRAYLLRAGELTGHGADLFFLPIDEVATVLAGSTAPLAAVPARRAAYDRYRALPPLPTVIRGRFDPAAWASDVDRRADVHDETARVRPKGVDISGFPGAAGVVEGTARVVSTVDEADALRPGEILVTPVTNVGWTPLFSRAAAVVTDVGAPLSHAAIVARELGITAVVGCGNATARIATGDRVRVDGTAGTVTILSEQDTEPAVR